MSSAEAVSPEDWDASPQALRSQINTNRAYQLSLQGGVEQLERMAGYWRLIAAVITVISAILAAILFAAMFPDRLEIRVSSVGATILTTSLAATLCAVVYSVSRVLLLRGSIVEARIAMAANEAEIDDAEGLLGKSP